MAGWVWKLLKVDKVTSEMFCFLNWFQMLPQEQAGLLEGVKYWPLVAGKLPMFPTCPVPFSSLAPTSSPRLKYVAEKTWSFP